MGAFCYKTRVPLVWLQASSKRVPDVWEYFCAIREGLMELGKAL